MSALDLAAIVVSCVSLAASGVFLAVHITAYRRSRRP
jgi:hypothetical protein